MVTVIAGLSGAGKSQYAADLFWHGSSVPCVLLTADHFKHEPFADTTGFFIELVKQFVKQGRDVIFDGVNLHPFDKARWEQAFEQIKWIHLDTPIEECIRRDAQREVPVGEAAIRRQNENTVDHADICCR